MDNLHAMDSRSYTQVLSHCYLHRVFESILLWVLVVSILISYTMMTYFVRVGLALGLRLCVKAFW